LQRIIQELKSFFRKGDLLLLLLCLVTSAFGCLMVASATDHSGSIRYILVQLLAVALGVMCYIIMSSIDVEYFAEHRWALAVFNSFLLLLLIPFGVSYDSGNKSWLNFPFLPVAIQPAEICKITFILIMASVMASHQNRISGIRSIWSIGVQLILLVGLNMAISSDLGVSLIFVFICIAMAFAGGVSLWWFGSGIAAVVAAFPVLWNFLSKNQQNRILVLLWPEVIDPMGINEYYHTKRSLLTLTGGGLTGQGLFNGNRTQIGALPAQHTDYIFSVIGEELGYLGCILVLLMLLAIIARCIYVGSRAQDYMRRMVCYGAAAALIFQVCINVGMCIGVAPVIGLTLPLISYGGSSTLTIYAMLGLVSGVHARPASTSHERYIRPPYDY
jgi:rod shape determining protein RodA